MTSTDVEITNISQSLPHKMAENSWHEEITSLSLYVYMGRQWRNFFGIRTISGQSESGQCNSPAISGQA